MPSFRRVGGGGGGGGEALIILLGSSESNFVYLREKEGQFIHIWNTFYSILYEPFRSTFREMKWACDSK